MTGNHPGRSGNPAKRANPGLDQLAAQIRNDRQGKNPELVALEGIEQQLLPLFVKVGGEQVDPVQAGVTALVLGQLFADLVTKLPLEAKQNSTSIIVNLLRMMGQRLYAGDLPSNELRCPFVLASGKPCNFSPSYTMGGTLTTVMRGHVALHHPGETWPPVEPDDGETPRTSPEGWEDSWSREQRADEDRALEHETLERAELVTCDTCGIPLDLEGDDSPNAGFITHAGVQCIRCARPDSDQAETIEREQQQLVHLVDQHRDEPTRMGICQACAMPQQLTADNLVVSHDIRSMLGWPTASPHECAGSGQPPLPTASVRVDQQRPEPSVGECSHCHFEVPRASSGNVALHVIDGTPFECPGSGKPPVLGAYRDAGMSDELVDQRPFDGSPFEGVRTFHPDGTVTYHDQAAAKTPVREHIELAPRNHTAILTRPDGTSSVVGHLEPGFDAQGNVVEVSLVRDSVPRSAPRVRPEECPHPKHSRMHLPGGERCLDCGTTPKPDRDGA
jgi:hypothetical protein